MCMCMFVCMCMFMCVCVCLFKSKLVSTKSKLKLYRSVIKPVAVYGCDTWVIVQRLSVFERKMLREIFGPTKEDD
jgi:hypothetical protein